MCTLGLLFRQSASFSLSFNTLYTTKDFQGSRSPQVSLLSEVSEPLQSPQAFKFVLKCQKQQTPLDRDLESPPPALLWPIPSEIRQRAHSSSL